MTEDADLHMVFQLGKRLKKTVGDAVLLQEHGAKRRSLTPIDPGTLDQVDEHLFQPLGRVLRAIPAAHVVGSFVVVIRLR